MTAVRRLDPYAELGIGPGADPATVRKAYRRRARETHPDHGGDPDSFQRVKRASLVLLDPAKRAKFDASGEVEGDAPDNAVADVMVAVAQLLDSVMFDIGNSGGDPARVDLLAAIGDVARKAKAGIAQNRRSVEKHLELSLRIERRFRLKAKGGGPNRMEALMQARIGAQRATLDNFKREDAKLDRALLFLKDYAFDHDAPAPHPMMGMPQFRFGSL
jgi:curved DNA-binding protein CbpA